VNANLTNTLAAQAAAAQAAQAEQAAAQAAAMSNVTDTLAAVLRGLSALQTSVGTLAARMDAVEANTGLLDSLVVSPPMPPTPSQPPSFAFTSCAELLAAYPTTPSGIYNITTPSGTFVGVLCDMAAGGWTRVFVAPGEQAPVSNTGLNPLVQSAVSVSLLSDTSYTGQFAKLSDADITSMSNGRYWVRCWSNTNNALAVDVYAGNSENKWDSRFWQQSGLSWTIDLHRMGTWNGCNANRAAPSYPDKGYVFASTAGSCGNDAYDWNINWGWDECGRTCYGGGGTWGALRGEIWVSSSSLLPNRHLLSAAKPPSPP
jgi:hypothetical protein